MSELVQIGGARGGGGVLRGSAERRPAWLRVKIARSESFRDVGKLIDGLSLHTVCEEARCPNIWECWGEHRTATFMIGGDVCTRACRYCSVRSGRPTAAPDPAEPNHVAAAVAKLQLAHAVITSVDRDDLSDFGAAHWAATVAAVRAGNPDCRIELLIPDFMGDTEALQLVLEARPDVVGHNTETVPRLFPKMRSKGIYARALEVLRRIDAYRRFHGIAMTSKSGLMVGLGERIEEILAVMDDLRSVSCDVLTLGQYLNPTRKHAPVDRFYTPDEFTFLRDEGLKRGFRHVESGPLVRSSYHAHQHVPGAI